MMIKLDNIYKRFGAKEILRGIDLEINKGETFVVLGPSGIGKSVLLKIMITLLEPDQGTVMIDQQRTSGLNEKDKMKVCEKFGMLFQDGALFDSLNVRENVGFALDHKKMRSTEEIDAVVRRNLDLVGLPDVYAHMPASLSGGMRKRVGLARAITHGPQILLYDEPTTGLDPVMANTINRLIIRLKEELQVTSVVVTHDMHSAFMIADRMAMVYDGRIRLVADKDDFKNIDDPVVQHFMDGIE